MEKLLTNLLQIYSLKSQNVFAGSVLHIYFVIKELSSSLRKSKLGVFVQISLNYKREIILVKVLIKPRHGCQILSSLFLTS